MMNGYEVQTSVFSIDMCDQLRYLTFQFGGIRECRRRHLDQYDLTLPFRVIMQEFLERTELYHTFSTSDASKEEHEVRRTWLRDSAIPFAKLP